MSKKANRSKDPAVALKEIPLTVHGIGMSAEGTAKVAAEFDRSLKNASCCQLAAMRVGLEMVTHGWDLHDLILLQADLNHLIKAQVDAEGKPAFSVSKALMALMKEKTQ